MISSPVHQFMYFFLGHSFNICDAKHGTLKRIVKGVFIQKPLDYVQVDNIILFQNLVINQITKTYHVHRY